MEAVEAVGGVAAEGRGHAVARAEEEARGDAVEAQNEEELEYFHLLRAFAVEFSLRQSEFAAAHGMHPTDVRALIRLLDAERMGVAATAGYLAEGLGLNSAGTTSVMDRLERLGYIERMRDTGDRRRVLLKVGPRAMGLGWAHFGAMIGETTSVLRDFRENERAAVRRFLVAAHAAVTKRPVLGSDTAADARTGAGSDT